MEPRVWNSLRNGVKKAVGASKPEQVLRKLSGRDQFHQSEFDAFIRALKDAGIAFLPIDAFVEQYQIYFAAGRHPKNDARFGHLKFDIHGDIVRPVEMARLLKRADSPGLFLMMHRHTLNDSWYGT